ncbi:ABC transporter substrate-binding protein [Saccharomonospora sp. NPDC006951]
MRTGKALLLVLLALLTQVSACTSTQRVTIIGPWTGTEEAAFRAVLDEFERQTGIGYDYLGTRSLSPVLAADVQQGTPPDIAVLSSPNELVNYQRQGVLHQLPELDGELRSAYSPQWLQLAQAGTERPYAVVVKAALKGLVWFNPSVLTGPVPTTWNQLVSLTEDAAAEGRTPWCMGMGAMSATGFPGSDWIEDILLRKYGAETYQRWVTGDLPWTAPEVRNSWKAWGELILGEGTIHGGRGGALLTNYTSANDTMFAANPDCFLEHQGSLVVNDYRSQGARFDFFPTPGPSGPGDAWLVSADLATMFRDTPAARELMRFLASAEGQRIWPSDDRGAVFTVRQDVAATTGSDAVTRDVARIISTADVLCYDASDLMPTAVTNAFHRAALGYLADPARLDELLAELERIRLGVSAQDWANLVCGR